MVWTHPDTRATGNYLMPIPADSEGSVQPMKQTQARLRGHVSIGGGADRVKYSQVTSLFPRSTVQPRVKMPVTSLPRSSLVEEEWARIILPDPISNSRRRNGP